MQMLCRRVPEQLHASEAFMAIPRQKEGNIEWFRALKGLPPGALRTIGARVLPCHPNPRRPHASWVAVDWLHLDPRKQAAAHGNGAATDRERRRWRGQRTRSRDSQGEPRCWRYARARGAAAP